MGWVVRAVQGMVMDRRRAKARRTQTKDAAPPSSGAKLSSRLCRVSTFPRLNETCTQGKTGAQWIMCMTAQGKLGAAAATRSG